MQGGLFTILIFAFCSSSCCCSSCEQTIDLLELELLDLQRELRLDQQQDPDSSHARVGQPSADNNTQVLRDPPGGGDQEEILHNFYKFVKLKLDTAPKYMCFKRKDKYLFFSEIVSTTAGTYWPGNSRSMMRSGKSCLPPARRSLRSGRPRLKWRRNIRPPGNR